jgi:hypothetical protein
MGIETTYSSRTAKLGEIAIGKLTYRDSGVLSFSEVAAGFIFAQTGS